MGSYQYKMIHSPATAMFIASIIGFTISVTYVWEINMSFGFAFAVAFILMFISSLVTSFS